jgi:hypothetical protein
VLTCAFEVHPERCGDLESGLEVVCIRGRRAPFRAEVGDLVYLVIGRGVAVEAHRFSFDCVDLGGDSDKQLVDIIVVWSGFEDVRPGVDLVVISTCERKRQVAEEI